MSALTTVVNPFSQARGQETVMMFSSGESNIFPLESRNIDASLLHTLGLKAGEKTGASVLAYPSQLTSFIFKDLISVYGIVDVGTAGSPSLQLALLSPITSTVSQKALKPQAGSLTSYVDRVKDLAFLYLHALHSDGQTYISEWSLKNNGAFQPITDIAPQSFKANSSLGFMYYNSEDKKTTVRFLIYQLSNSSIGMFNLKTRQTVIVSETNNSAAATTSVAATWVPKGDGRPEDRIVIYYIERNGYLYSANCVLGDSPSFTTYSEKPRKVGDGYMVRDFSQLSVHRDDKNERTIIFATNTNDDIVPMYDDWSNLLGN